MSDMSVSNPAQLVAAGIRNEAEHSAGHRRMYLGTLFGVLPQEVFNALMADTPREQVSIEGIEPLVALRLSRAESHILLIPYLVTRPGAAGPNGGSEGYAALLRSRFRDGAKDNEARVLLILHSDPVETIKTAAEDASGLESLSWARLCLQAARQAVLSSVASGLVEAVSEDLSELPRGDREILESLMSLATTKWRSPDEAGKSLWHFGVYVSDPGWSSGDLPKRLRDSRRWREQLDRWSEPGRDFESILRKRIGDSEVVDTILDAVRPNGLDFGRFTLDQLDAGERSGSPSFTRPLRGFRAAMSCESGLAAWFDPRGADLVMRVPGQLGQVTAEMLWADGERYAGTIVPARQEASFRIPANASGWRFGSIALRRSGRLLSEAPLAAYFSDGTWFPVEGSRRIDVEEESFVVEDEASAYLVSTPRYLGRVELPTSELLPGSRSVLTVSRNQESHPLPVYLVGQGTDEEGPEIYEEEGPEVRETLFVPSPVHAMFRSGSPAVVISSRGEPPSRTLAMHIETQPYEVRPFQIAGVDALDLERQVLASPDNWTFLLGGGENQALQPDPKLERLSMETVPANELIAFKRSRVEFFSALAPYGSAYAAGDPAVRQLAEVYVRTYADLLAALPEHHRGNPEFDRCLLVDTIALPGGEARFTAPSNPQTVAFYLAFWDFAAKACASLPRMLEADIASISPIGLLPLTGAEASWFEAQLTTGFLWKAYRRVDDGLPVLDYSARFIARKLKFFLKVHPGYADPRQSLSLCMFEPGDGKAIVDALTLFYADDLKSDTYFSLPQIDLTLVTPKGETPSAISELLATAQGRPIERLVRTRVQVTVSEADPERPFGNMPVFSHITFVHKTSAGRHPGPVALYDRASTMYAGGLAASPGRLSRRQGRELEFFWGAFGTTTAGSIDSKVHPDLQRISVRMLELVGSQHREMLQTGFSRMLTMTADPDFMLEVYERSVWVVHLERLVGLELFAPDPGRPQRYLIDYEESFAGQGAVDGITATEDIGPYHSAVRKALTGFDISPESMERLLNLLNAIAGSWALQLLHSSPADILEKVGVVAAASVLHDLDRAFDSKGGIGVLLSSEELIHALPAALEPESAKSDDLIFLWVPYSIAPRIFARVIEVKFATKGSGDLTRARQQLVNTCDWLESSFAPGGPGHLFRSRDLAQLIRASAARNATFRLAALDRDITRFESTLGAIASGQFSVECRFWVDGREFRGDVISVELESSAAAVRTAGLPGSGDAFGLIRLGRPSITSLADGRPITSDAAWPAVSFTPVAVKPRGPDAHSKDESAPRTYQDVRSERSGDDQALKSPSKQPRVEATEVSKPDDEAELLRVARELDAAVVKYGLELEPFRPQLAQIGPSVIRFRSKPLGKQALDGIIRRAPDIGREVGAPEGVIVAQEPYYIVVDVPRRKRQTVYFSDHTDALLASQGPGALNFLLGIAPSGALAIEDIARLPHLLIAGATGSGKSILLRSILCSLLLVHPPDELKIFLIDPKQIDFIPFEEAPHLVSGGIVTDAHQAVADLQENIELELAKRRPILRRAAVSNALEFYESGGSRKELPQMVIMVDEFAELAAGLDAADRAGFMGIIQRYGQLTRAYGIYLVLATQRPSVQVITGDIKANLTARIALKLLTSQDSMTILGHSGAESLRDKGDLIFEHGGRRERLQGFLVRPADIVGALDRWRG
jgi:FtsK/SpoIIIE family